MLAFIVILGLIWFFCFCCEFSQQESFPPPRFNSRWLPGWCCWPQAQPLNLEDLGGRFSLAPPSQTRPAWLNLPGALVSCWYSSWDCEDTQATPPPPSTHGKALTLIYYNTKKNYRKSWKKDILNTEKVTLQRKWTVLVIQSSMQSKWVPYTQCWGKLLR